MRFGKTAFLGLVIAVALTAYAVGAGSKSSENVVLCAAKKGGDLTLAQGGKCAKAEKKLSIAKQGPQGMAGPQGIPGPSGALPAPPAQHFVAPAVVACAVQTGTFCVTETGLCWDNGNAGGGFAPVSFRKDADGFVHLEGAFNNFNSQGACGGTEPPVFYLPTGFKPTGGSQRFAVAPCSGVGNGFITIAPNGQVSETSSTDVCLNLSGIVFHADA